MDVTRDDAHGPDLDRLVEGFCEQMAAHPAGRLRLVIYRRRLYSAENAWRGKTYTGVNPHEQHAHIEVWPTRRGQDRQWTIQQ